MRKSLLVIISFLAIGILTSSFFTNEPGKFKNLKILPMSISEHALDSIMDLYSTSLGVDCAFCHGNYSYESDVNKHKLVAREMMQMTDSINAKYFPYGGGTSQTITCNSCHHGETFPARFKPVKKENKPAWLGN